MTFEITNETEIDLEIEYQKIIEDAIMASLDEEKCPYEAEVSVTITDDEGIHQINREFRKIDRATDVLSFPMNEFEKPGEFDHLEDIVLSAEHIIQQAKEYGHSRERELAFLVVHSMLHLMGYDHMEDEERIAMEERQRQILDGRGYTR